MQFGGYDINGCADTLRAFLTKPGYVERDLVHRHPNRWVIFPGDFITR